MSCIWNVCSKYGMSGARGKELNRTELVPYIIRLSRIWDFRAVAPLERLLPVRQ
jgi:hypothetical protein